MFEKQSTVIFHLYLHKKSLIQISVKGLRQYTGIAELQETPKYTNMMIHHSSPALNFLSSIKNNASAIHAPLQVRS